MSLSYYFGQKEPLDTTGHFQNILYSFISGLFKPYNIIESNYLLKKIKSEHFYASLIIHTNTKQRLHILPNES